MLALQIRHQELILLEALYHSVGYDPFVTIGTIIFWRFLHFVSDQKH